MVVTFCKGNRPLSKFVRSRCTFDVGCRMVFFGVLKILNDTVILIDSQTRAYSHWSMLCDDGSGGTTNYEWQKACPRVGVNY